MDKKKSNRAFMTLASIVLLTAAMLVCMALKAEAADTHEVTLVAEWAWSGSDTTVQGFRLYKDGAPIHDIVGADKRTEELTYQLENGKHLFSLTAYGEKDGVPWETPHSPEYQVEYLYVPTDDGRPAPTTIYIRIN